ncbi:MAG TPA: glutamyl-tRNA reductase, partial [Longimicrobium sp.]|nr:glutamyl-tRNA reductase [Longimicrobium sp.]
PDGERAARAVEEATSLLAARVGEDAQSAARYFYLHRDRDAARHLFRVAAGLDSMIVGEPQIQGQVKDAYAAAREAAGEGGPVVGAALNRLFQQAFSVGGRVRAETALGRGAASVSSAAVDLAKKIFGSLRGRRALVLGAGEMSEVTLQCLRAEGVHSVVVANRTWDRARELAERLECAAVRWDEFPSALAWADIAICSTAAPVPVLTAERVRQALPHGPAGPLCVIDIAVPRDVEPAVGDLPNVFLYDIDDLQQVVEASLGRRQAELPAAEAIVAQGVDDFWAWYAGLAVVPTIRDLRERGEAVRRAEMERALRQLSHLSPEDQVAIDALTRSLLNKILHAPTARLREAAGNGRGTGVLDTVRYLFELDAHAAPHDDDSDAAAAATTHANRDTDRA